MCLEVKRVSVVREPYGDSSEEQKNPIDMKGNQQPSANHLMNEIHANDTKLISRDDEMRARWPKQSMIANLVPLTWLDSTRLVSRLECACSCEINLFKNVIWSRVEMARKRDNDNATENVIVAVTHKVSGHVINFERQRAATIFWVECRRNDENLNYT